MNPTKLFPLIITDKLAQTKEFYTKRAGFQVSAEQGEYLQLRFGDDPEGPEIAFMASSSLPDLPTVRPFSGSGLLISVPTANADAHHSVMTKRGATPTSAPSDKPWGWRSFFATCPNGVVLDFFHVPAQAGGGDATS